MATHEMVGLRRNLNPEQRPVQKTGLACAALQLAAGSLRDAARLQEQNRVHSHVMFFSNRAPDSTNHRLDIERQTSIGMRMRGSVAVAVPIAVAIAIAMMAVRRIARFHFGCDDQA